MRGGLWVIVPYVLELLNYVASIPASSHSDALGTRSAGPSFHKNQNCWECNCGKLWALENLENTLSCSVGFEGTNAESLSLSFICCIKYGWWFGTCFIIT